MSFKFWEREIRGVFEISVYNASDERGGLFKEYDKAVFSDNGIEFVPIESTMIFSRENVLRGIHFQKIKEQDRIVRCVSGNVWVVIVDLRKDNEYCGRWIDVNINDGREVYIPKGCALGTLAIEDSWILCMYGGNRFDSEYSQGIRWDDDTLLIEWPIHNRDKIIISEKDRNWMNYREYLKQQHI